MWPNVRLWPTAAIGLMTNSTTGNDPLLTSNEFFSCLELDLRSR